MTNRSHLPALAGLLLLAGLAVPAPAAAIDYDITAGLRLSDDVQLFVNLSNDYYRADPEVAVAVLHKLPHPGDEFPVLLFLAAESGRPVDAIWKLRLQGKSWSAVLVQLGVDPSRLFAGMDRDPGPPYGKAWGHWRKRGGRPAASFTVSDEEFVSLVKIQITSGHFGLSPDDVVREHRAGKKFERIAAEKHKARGGRGPQGPTGKTASPGKGKGKGKH